MLAVYELIKWSFLTHDIWHPLYGLGYQLWSGILGATAIFSGLYIIAKHKNCHEHRCWRIGRVLLADGTLTCHKHDPRHEGSHKEAGHVQRMWDQHLARHGISIMPTPLVRTPVTSDPHHGSTK